MRFYFFVVLVFSSNVEIFAFCAVGSMFNLKTVFDSKKTRLGFFGPKKGQRVFRGKSPLVSHFWTGIVGTKTI